jgi:predicted Mrr-cat superfamily restriction endonuclease
MGLWMVRAFPLQMDRMKEFLENNIIAVSWGIDDLTGCQSKEQIAEVVARKNLKPRDASLKVGLLHKFVNQMQKEEICIVPYEGDVFYIALIKSDYFYNVECETYAHQRKVEWLFNGKVFSREELPEKLQASLKSQLGLADISKHESVFKHYINKKLDNSENDSLSEEESSDVHDELAKLVNNALDILKEEISSDDPERRLRAAKTVLELNKAQIKVD